MKRHAFDPLSFVAGSVLVVFALFFLSGARTAADLGAAWLWAVLVLAPGALLVLSGIRRVIEERQADPAEGSRDGDGDREA
jgi:membrane protein implicated in regulation of membrane protease activity